MALVGDVLAVNAGSTSLKLSLVARDESSRHVGSLAEAAALGPAAVGHRVVHGGARFRDPVVLDDGVLAALDELTPLAPLHNAPAVEAIREARALLPGVPHVAVFDSAFHATIPDAAATYAVPAVWREEWGIRRVGFHGLSVRWAAERVRARRLVVCHLGGGSSVTAVLDGRSVDTTMGFTPLEGLPMATRSGTVDPGALLYVLREGLLTLDELDQALERESGLLALGGTADVRALEAAGSPALGVLEHRVAAAVAAMAASLGGLDALAFTAGIGEHAAGTRARVCARLGFLGVRLDPAANEREAAGKDAEVAAAGSAVRVAVVHAREDVVLARDVRAACGGG